VAFFFFTGEVSPKREIQNYKFRQKKEKEVILQGFLITRTEERKNK
jgi:hypothetical protein